MMIKYQQRWYSKAFAMFLALTILIAAPFSTVQAYAMEGAQLTESVNPGDTSPDTISEMDGGVPKEAPLETSEAIDSGRPPEESASPTDAAPAGIGLFGDDTTPPAFDGNPTISPQSKGSRQIYILVKAQEEAYFNAVLLPDGANSPTKEQVIAGQDADGNPALRVYKNNKKEIDMHIVGFVPQHGTEYDVYVVLKDDADNTSEPLKVDFKSPDAAEYFAQDFPMNGAVQPDGSKQVEVKIKLENIDSSKKGKVYWVLLPNEARTPSIEQIAQGTDSNNDPAISSGSPEFAPGINDSFLVTGTVGGTDYDLYMVVGNTYYANPLASCTDVVKLDVTTPPDIAGEKLCEIDGTEYATLQEAMEAAGTTATIKLLKSFTTVQGVIIDRKHITFDLNGQTLTIDTTANEGLKVTEGTVALTGEGKLNATGKLYGVWANKGTVTVDTAASGNDGIGVYAMGGSKVTVRGNATGQDNGVYATDSGTMVKVNGNVTSTDGQIQGAAHAQNQAEVIVGGNVSAISGYGARTSNSGVITVEGDVYGLRAGAFTEGAGGSITVKGDLSSHNHCAVITNGSSGNITVEGTVTPQSSASYVLINNVRLEKDAGVSDPGKSGYLKYSGSGATGVVWVKDPLAAKVWEVSDDEGLENALGSFRDGDTIKLMANIDYDKGIAIDGKTVTFDVDGYILNVKNSIENGTGLNVMNGGKVFLTGSGALNVEGYRYGVQVHSNNANSEATVTKATAIGPEGKAAHTNNKAKLTVLGDVTATGNRGFGIHAQQGSLLEVKGNINATNQGVNVSGATAKVTGNVQAISKDPLTGKDIGIGVNVYNGVAEIGGNVTANRVGAMIRAGGSITIDGMITAPAYIQFNDNAPTTIDDYLPETTKVGYRTYSDGKSTVWIGSVGDSAPAYLLTVVSGTGGGTYAAGAQVPIKANPPVQGKVFDKWTTSNGGSFEDANSDSTTFIMPSNEVTVTATYKDAPVKIYTLTVSGSYAGISGAGQYAPGTQVSIHAGSRSNYSFTGWTTSGDGTFADANSASTTFIMPNSNTTVTANWTYAGGGSGSGSSGDSSSGGSPTTLVTILPEKKPDQPVTVAAPVTATAGANGAASTVIPDKVITDAITKAQAEAKAQGKTKHGISVELNVTMPKSTTSLTAALTQSSLNSLVNAGVTSLKINGYPATISFDKKALTEIRKQSDGNVTITIKPSQNLTTAAKKLIGSRPVYGITVSCVKNSKTLVISAFNGGIATISILYKPSKNEAVGYLYGVYVDAKGNATRIDGSVYDTNEGAILISTDHLSTVYGVSYTEPSAKFTDIRTHWGKESIDYVVGRGLLSGTSETIFAPNTSMTRGMLVTALGRLAGVDVKAYTTNSFTDVKADSAFLPYIEWAYKKGVVQGTGNSQFAPDRAITREEIAVIFANYAKAIGYKLPVTREATTYADAFSIGSYYQTAVTAMQQAGIMMGGNGNKFNPKASATRAEVSSMLHRYIKLTIDPNTAQGWALNDAGQYLYYKNGKVLTGMQIIDGVKYFFNTDGTLKTSWVKDANNWRYYSGNTMLVGFWDIGTNGNNKTYYFTKDGIMVAGKWLEIGDKWYYFNADGSLAKGTKINGYEVDENGVRKTK
jgi:uncharacterized repeat protein (TIGR02543 family)